MPDIQILRPDVTLSFDIDPAPTVRTRKRLLQEVTSERTLVGGMHLNAPGFIRLEHDGLSYAIGEEPVSFHL